MRRDTASAGAARGHAMEPHTGQGTITMAIAGNPNCGKSTIFNGLTGSTQQIGNWPGVTVEKKEGFLAPMSTGPAPSERIRIVDLPGVYNLAAFSQDEQVARDFLVGGEPDLVLNIVDATNLERNLFLTLQLLETGTPTVVVLTMIDLAEDAGLKVDTVRLSDSLGCPVLAVDATRPEGLDAVRSAASRWALQPPKLPDRPPYRFSDQIERTLDDWGGAVECAHLFPRIRSRWVAIRLFEQDEWALAAALAAGIPPGQVNAVSEELSRELGEAPDVIVADVRYGCIREITHRVITRRRTRESRDDRIDRLLMHRVWGIPIFLAAMFLVFWVTINVGGLFIPFFDKLSGAIFVDGTAYILSSAGAPAWLIAILSGGIGTGIQTVATFIPVMFFMFLMLSLLEDSGYMARSAFVTDRFMGMIGLPGKAFVPLVVGFGCTVPAIMATRTLDNRRDRLLTIFMAPLMSCGARLPVYALFAAAFFPAASGAMVFSLYLLGIVLAVLTGLLLRRSLFAGEQSHLLMELPPYHRPRLGSVLTYTWERVRLFVFRAGKVVVLGIAILSFFNSLGTDGSFGNEDTGKSVLSAAGRKVTPLFGPMGISHDNWPATVAIFSGVFAKEAVVGTLTSLYAETDRGRAAGSAAPGRGYNLIDELGAAIASLPEAFKTLWASLSDPLGLRAYARPRVAVSAPSTIFASLHRHFSLGPASAYAYLLFILVYFPCLATMGTAMREMGPKYTVVMAVYLTAVAWGVATLFYQIAAGGSLLWGGLSALLLAGIVMLFLAAGRPHRLRSRGTA